MSGSLIETDRVWKSFEGVQALRGVSLRLGRGEIVALLGHNGSGKSTLVKIIDGVIDADSGEVRRGRTRVHVIHQSLGLIDSLSAIENLDIARPMGGRGLLPFRRRREAAHLATLLRRFGLRVDPDLPVGRLTNAQQTILAIVRALDGWDAEEEHVLILDEPTATLHDEETTVLLDAVRSAAAQGVGVVYISHRLQEVLDLADRAIVLRGGEVAAEHRRGEYSKADLLAVIADRSEVRSERNRPALTGPPVLTVTELTGTTVAELSFEVRRGEIVGIAGLLGSGMEEVGSLVFGAAAPDSGTIAVEGRPIRLGDPRSAIDAGLGYLPPDRLRRGGVAAHSARENVTLPSLRSVTSPATGSIRTEAEAVEVEHWMRRVRASPLRVAQRLSAFSGGNQQKVLLAKWLRLAPSVLLLDEPTQGVDVGAQAEIHSLIQRTADDGTAVVVASSDTHELAELCDRVLIMTDGRLTGELDHGAITEQEIIRAILDKHATEAPAS